MKVSSPEELGEVLRARRKELDLTQSELSDLTGVSARTIFELENQNSAITLTKLLPILSVLGLEIQLAIRTND